MPFIGKLARPAALAYWGATTEEVKKQAFTKLCRNLGFLIFVHLLIGTSGLTAFATTNNAFVNIIFYLILLSITLWQLVKYTYSLSI